jgi:hypothetical protein
MSYNTSYVSNCELCSGKGAGGYMPLEQIVSDYSHASSYSSSGSLNYDSQVSYSMISGPGKKYSSNLEYAVSNSEVQQEKSRTSAEPKNSYNKKIYFHGYLTNSKINSSYASDNNFALQDIDTKFIGDAKEIAEHVENAFRNVIGEEFPEDIAIHICSRDRLKEFNNEFGGRWNNGIVGFSVNRKKSGLKSEIFVCQGELANVMATIGHEIGHCISAPLENIRDEEAKAFAFEFAWIKTIDDNNIAGLKGCFNLANPAKNNVHDKAFEFVDSMIKKGAEAIKLCFMIIQKELSTKD